MRSRSLIVLIGVVAGVPLFAGPSQGAAKPSATIHPSSRSAPRFAGRIAFTRGSLGPSEIDIFEPSSGRITTVANPAEGQMAPAWSPDGSHIAYYDTNPDGFGEASVTRGPLRTVRADGSEDRRIGGGTYIAPPTWSPTGDEIAFVHADWAAGNAATELWAYDAGGFGYRLLPIRSDVTIQAPVWSPDGRRIAYAATRYSNGCGFLCFEDFVESERILVTDIRTGDTRFVANGGYPSWSPDGRRLAYVVGGNKVVVADRSGSRSRVIYRTSTAVERPSWSPDGAWIAFALRRPRNSLYGLGYVGSEATSIWAVRPDGSGRTRLLSLTDGSTIADPVWGR